MRGLRILAWTLGGLVAVVLVAAGTLFAAVQTDSGKRWLVATISEVASTPDRKIELQGLSGFVPTDLALAEIRISDRQGAWLRIENAQLRWSFASLFSGRLRIDMVGARRIDVERPPLPPETPRSPSPEPSPEGGGGLPLGIDVRSVAIPELHLGEAIVGVDSRWKLGATALLAKDLGQSDLHLKIDRIDGPQAHLSADLRFELARFGIDGQVALEEGAQGVVAALLGRPDLDRTALRLVVKGDAERGAADLQASAGEAVASTGVVRWQREGTATNGSFKLAVTTSNLPDTPLARLLRDPVNLDGEASVDEGGVVTLRRALLEVGSAKFTASARYDPSADQLGAAADLDAPQAGAFADLLGGMGWRDLQASVRTELRGLNKKPAGTASITARAHDVTNAPPGPIDFTAKLELRPDGKLAVEESSLATGAATLRASGDYMPETGAGDVRATVDVGSFAPFSSLAGGEFAGRGRLELTARTERNGVQATWQGAFEDLVAPGVPPDLLKPELRLSGRAELNDGAWSLSGVRVAGEAVSLQIDGRGRERNGELTLSASMPRLEALQSEVTGRVTATARLNIEGEAVRGDMQAEGTVADQPLAFNGRFQRAEDGGISVPRAEGSWASAEIDIRDLAVTPQGASGDGHLRMARLQDLTPLVGTPLEGSIDITIATERDSDTVKVALRGDKLRGGPAGAGTLQLDATVREPFGVAETDARFDANRLVGVQDVSRIEGTVKGTREAFDIALRAAGGRTNANVAARIEQTAEEIRVALSRLEARYQGIPLKLAGATTITMAGERITVQPATLQVGAGRLRAGGVVDPGESDLELDIAALPLNLLSALTPGTNIEGTLQAKLRMRGPSGNPRIDATYNASGLRMRQPGMGLIPTLAVQGSASVVERRATFDTRLRGGGATNLTFKGRADLAPFAANVDIGGVLDIGPFAPLMGDDIRNVAGTIRPNLNLEIAGSRIGGRGTAALNGLTLALPDAGVRLSKGEGVLALEGDTLRLQRLAFQTNSSGQMHGTGTVRLDPSQGFPHDLRVTTQKAVVVSRSDMVATVTSDVKVAGSTTTAIDVGGRIRVDRADINIGAEQAAGYPTVEVREINGPNSAAQPRRAAAPRKAPAKAQGATPIRLALTIEAPSAVFVRGRGLEAEMGGQFQVTGEPAAPAVIGGLNLRRGDFNLAGRRMTFRRGSVSLENANTIDPRLDFVATTKVQQNEIELAIGGTARAPKFTVSSNPPLPQDEAMAVLLFGKPSSGLSPFEILSAAQALAELSGKTSSGGGFFARLRRNLGLDQLSVTGGSQGTGSGEALSVGAGRYVAPGVYVGTRQGGDPGSNRGVVEIEVLDNVKVEGDIAADANSRIGVKMQWDY